MRVWVVLVVVMMFVLAGCSGVSSGDPAAYAEQARNVTPAPVPEPPTTQTATPTSMGVQRYERIDRVRVPPEDISALHHATVGDSFTIREQEVVRLSGSGVILDQRFEYREDNGQRYVNVTLSGPLVQSRFNTSSIREEYWSTPNGTVRVRTMNNESTVASDALVYTQVMTATDRSTTWARRMAGNDAPHSDIEGYFDTFYFVVPNASVPVNESLEAIATGDTELVLTHGGISDPSWMFDVRDLTEVRAVNASARIASPGLVVSYGFSYTAFQFPNEFTTTRHTTYHAINTTTVPPVPENTTTPDPA